jgi:hypothetical protein
MNSSESSSQNSPAPQSFLLECCLFVFLSALVWLIGTTHIILFGSMSDAKLMDLSYLNFSLSIVFAGYIIMHHFQGRRIMKLKARIKATMIAALTLMAFPISCKLWLPVFQTQAVEIVSLLGLTTLILLYRDTLSTAAKKSVVRIGTVLFWLVFPIVGLTFPVILYTYINSYVIYKYGRRKSENNHCLKKLALVNLACSPILFLVLLNNSIGPFIAYPELIFLLVSAWLLTIAMGLIIAQVNPKNFDRDEIAFRLQESKLLRPNMKMMDWVNIFQKAFLPGVILTFLVFPRVSIGGDKISYNRLASAIPTRIQSLERMIPNARNPYFLDNSHVGFGDGGVANIYNLESGKMDSTSGSAKYPLLPVSNPTLESPNQQFRLITKEGTRNIYCLIATSNSKVLLQFPDELKNISPEFSPDSQRLAYSVRSGNSDMLYVWNLASLSR